MSNPMPYIESAVQSANNGMNMYNAHIKDFMQMVMQKISEFLNLPANDKIASIDWGNIQSIFSTLGIIFLIVMLVSIGLYLLRAIGLYVAAKNSGEKLAWLAFIPYGCLYAMGSIVSDTKIFGISIHKAQLLLPALVVSMCLPFTGTIASILFALFYFGILYRIYQELCPKYAVIFLIFSIILPILHPLFIFFTRNGNKSTKKSN